MQYARQVLHHWREVCPTPCSAAVTRTVCAIDDACGPLLIRQAFVQRLTGIAGAAIRKAVWVDKAAWWEAQATLVECDLVAGWSASLWAMVKSASSRRLGGRRPAAPRCNADGRVLQSAEEIIADREDRFSRDFGPGGVLVEGSALCGAAFGALPPVPSPLSLDQ